MSTIVGRSVARARVVAVKDEGRRFMGSSSLERDVGLTDDAGRYALDTLRQGQYEGLLAIGLLVDAHANLPRAGKGDGADVRVLDQCGARGFSPARQEVDDAGGETRLLEYRHELSGDDGRLLSGHEVLLRQDHA